MPITTDTDGHDWQGDTQTQTWKRSTPTRDAVITLCEFAEYPYQLDIRAKSFSIIDAGFATFDAAAHFAHISIGG